MYIQAFLDANKQFVFEQLSNSGDWENLVNLTLLRTRNKDADGSGDVKALRQDNSACNIAEYTSDTLVLLWQQLPRIQLNIKIVLSIYNN